MLTEGKMNDERAGYAYAQRLAHYLASKPTTFDQLREELTAVQSWGHAIHPAWGFGWSKGISAAVRRCVGVGNRAFRIEGYALKLRDSGAHYYASVQDGHALQLRRTLDVLDRRKANGLAPGWDDPDVEATCILASVLARYGACGEQYAYLDPDE